MFKRISRVQPSLRRSFAESRFGEWINYGYIMKEIHLSMEKLRNKEIVDTDFAREIYKLIEREELIENERADLVNTVENGIWVNNQVARLVLSETIEKISKIGYSESILTEAFELLAAIITLRGKNSTAPGDVGYLDIHYDHRFESLIEVFKYGLTKGNYIKPESIARILRALIALDYKSNEIQHLVQEKLKTNRYIPTSTILDRLSPNTPMKDLLDLPLINKKGFYNKTSLDQVDIQFSAKFNRYAGTIISMKKSSTPTVATLTSEENKVLDVLVKGGVKVPQLVKQQEAEVVAGVEPTATPVEEKEASATESANTITEEDMKSIQESLDTLKNVFEQGKHSLVKISESVMELRDLYLRLGDLQKKEFVYSNISIIIDLIEIEQLLLELGIITPMDIKHLDRNNKILTGANRIGPLIRQIVHELGGSSTLLEDLQKLPISEETQQQKYFSNEIGMYASGMPEALEALAEYANSGLRDIKPKETYNDESVEELVNKDLIKEEYIYQNEKFPIESLRQLYFDPLVDKKVLNTAHYYYHKSSRAVFSYIESLFNNSYIKMKDSLPTEKVNQLQLLHAATLAKSVHAADLILESLPKAQKDEDFDFVKAMRALAGSPDAVPKKFISDNEIIKSFIKSAAKFEDMKPREKIDFLYGLAVWAGRSDQGRNVFQAFCTDIKDNLWAEMCSNQGGCRYPVPEWVRKLSIVWVGTRAYLDASPKALDKFFMDLHLSTVDYLMPEDNRDPVYNVFKDTIANIFGPIQPATAVLARQLTPSLVPISEIPTLNGYNTMIFFAREEQCGTKNNITVGAASEAKILEDFYSKALKTKMRVLVIPFAFLRRNQDKSRPGFIAEILRLMYTTATEANLLNKDHNLLKLSQDQTISKTPVPLSGEYGQVAKSIKTLKTYISSLSPKNQQWINSLIDKVENNMSVLLSSSTNIEVEQAIARENFMMALFGLHSALAVVREPSKTSAPSQLSSVHSIIEDICKNMSENNSQAIPINVPIFAGRRVGIDMLNPGEEIESTVDELEFLNYELLAYPELVPYEDWRGTLENQNPLFVSAGKAEVAGPFGTVYQSILPESLSTFKFIRPTLYSLNWEASLKKLDEETSDSFTKFEELVKLTNRVSDSFKVQQALMLSLCRLKQEAKLKGDLEERVKILAHMDFLQVIAKHYSNPETRNSTSKKSKSGLTLPRSPDSYANYCTALLNNRRYRSRYGKFLKEESEKTKELLKWQHVLRVNIPQMHRALTKKGKTHKDLQEFYKYRDFVKAKYYEELRKQYDYVRPKDSFSHYEIRQKLLSLNLENYTEIEEASIEQTAEYKTAGNNARFFSRRFQRAQLDLVKLGIIYKVTRKIDLTPIETEFLESWKRQVLANSSQDFNDEGISMQLGELTEQDKLDFKALGFEIEKQFENYSIKELAFELVELLNRNLIPEFENSMMHSHLQRVWAITPTVPHYSNGYVSNKKKYLLDTLEDIEWERASMFTQEDIDTIAQIFGVGRGVTATDKAKWNVDRQSLIEFMESINESDERWTLLNSWLERKGTEIQNRSDSIVSPLIKSDSELSKLTKDESNNLWIDFFKKSSDKISAEEISSFAQGLLSRGYLLSKYFPPRLLKFLPQLLAHPLLNPIDRSSIVGLLKLLKVDLNAYKKTQLLYEAPIIPLTAKNYTIGLLNKYKDSQTIQEEFQTGSEDVGSVFSKNLATLWSPQNKGGSSIRSTRLTTSRLTSSKPESTRLRK